MLRFQRFLIALMAAVLVSSPASATQNKTWNNVTYAIPESGERNWASLSDFLVALADNAQTVKKQKTAVRIATATPVTVSATTDFAILTKLTVPGAVAVNLPAAASGMLYAIVDGTGDAASNNITISPAAGNINGSTTYVINVNRGGVVLSYTGSEWTVVAEFTRASAGTGIILRNKIATGTANHVVINDGSGYLSSEAALTPTRGGTGVSNNASATLTRTGNYDLNLTLSGATGVTLPTTGTLSTLDGSETFTNKTLTSPKINENVALTTTSTKLNYLTSATGTTGTASTNVVFSTSPTLVTPTLGAATATSINKMAITAPSSSSTLAVADGKTATISNTLTFTGTDSSSVAFGAGGTAAYTANKLSAFSATSSSELAGVISDETGSGALVFGTAPTITLANGTGLPISTGVSGLGTGVATALATPSSANIATAVTDETGSGALVFGTAPTITLANGTGLPISTGVSGLGSNVATFLATPSSANFAAAVTGEQGSGAVVFDTSPTITTPTMTSPIVTGSVTYSNQAEARFRETTANGDTFYEGFKAPADLSANKIWTLPTGDGSANQVLSTDGSATLQWASGLSSSLNQYNVSVGNSANTATSTNTNLIGDIKATTTSQSYAVTSATPGVFTVTAHGFATGDKAYVTVTQNGFTANTTYFIHKIDADTFHLSSSLVNLIAATYLTSSGTTAGTIISGGFTVNTGVRGVLGNTAATGGYVGEVINSGQITNTVYTSNTSITGASIALTPGAWLIYYNFDVEADTGASASNRTLCELEVYNSTASAVVANTPARNGTKTTAGVAGADNIPISNMAVVNISANSTFIVRGSKSDVAGTGSCTAELGAGSTFYGLRIY